MPLKPDGKAARVERVTFTKNSAERIGKVVRIVEAGDRDARPISFAPRLDGASQKTFRVCTFTGAWAIGSIKTVTYKNQTSTPNTANATNLFWPLPESDEVRDCAIAKDGAAWYLLVPRLYSDNALTGASLGGSLQFTRASVISLGTASTVQIAVTTCSTAAS